MGNSPSAPSRPSTSSPASAAQGPSAARKEPRLRDSVQTQRVAAPPEPSLAQASGTSVSRRSRNAHSQVQHGGKSEEQSHSPRERIPQPHIHEKNHPVSQKPDPAPGPSKPVPVPAQPTAIPLHTQQPTSIAPDASSLKSPYSFSQLDPNGNPQDGMSYHITRPPRLPLPIEEEVHTPGSPITAAADADAPTLNMDELGESGLPSRTSGLSSTTLDDEVDDEELPIDKTKATVPTQFEWTGGGEKVYVTGTIFQWSRKSKLHADSKRPGYFASTIHVRPGTHHVRFIVDGNMTISPDLPTTVDFGNNLVNYIEVSADDVPKELDVANTEAMGTPVPDNQNKLESEAVVEEGETAEAEPVLEPPPRTKPMVPLDQYTSHVPQYLLDLDKAEESKAYQYAAAIVEKLPTPPSLPGFLGRPILNAATPMKDDNSVLNMPNHTVLNHLATTSIKNGVLCVSATTRYKKKYVTTILYKPAGEDAM